MHSLPTSGNSHVQTFSHTASHQQTGGGRSEDVLQLERNTAPSILPEARPSKRTTVHFHRVASSRYLLDEVIQQILEYIEEFPEV
jgi:hypothetical protein